MKKIGSCMNSEYVAYKKHPVYTSLLCGDNGEIYSLASGRFVLGRLSHNGYRRVGFGFMGKKLQKQFHRIIYEAFNGIIPHGMFINHKDGIKLNNSLGNLELCTPHENIRHAVAHDLIRTKNKSTKTKTQQEDRDNIRSLRLSGMTYKNIADIYNVTASHICAICKKRDRWGKRDE